MAGFPDKTFAELGEKEKLRQGNAKHKLEIALVKQNAEEEQRASNVEVASLREEENNVEVQNVGDATLPRLEEQTLIASIESKEIVNTELQSKLCGLQKDLENTQDELKKSLEREEVKSSEVKKLEKRCNDLFSQITELICLQQESEAQINSLKQRIVHLEEENEMLSITNQVFSLD